MASYSSAIVVLQVLVYKLSRERDSCITCAANGSYTILVHSEASSECLLPHVFVKLVTTGEIEESTIELITGQQPVNKPYFNIPSESKKSPK